MSFEDCSSKTALAFSVGVLGRLIERPLASGGFSKDCPLNVCSFDSFIPPPVLLSFPYVLYHLEILSYFCTGIFFLLYKLLGGYVDRVTDWCVTGHGFAPRRVQL